MLIGAFEFVRKEVSLPWLLALALLLTISTSVRAQSFNALLGSWSGQGQLTFKGAATENVKCKSYNTSKAGDLRLVIRCASASYRVEIRSKLNKAGAKLSGQWEERTYNATGKANGSIDDGSLSLTVSGGGLTGEMYVKYDARTMTVSIITRGIKMQSVRITLARMTK